MGIPAASKAGRSSSVTRRETRRACFCSSSRQASSSSSALSPSGDSFCFLLRFRFSILRLSPPIRFIANSSYSMPMMPANLTRSSKGKSGSSASASTRRAKLSQLNSRLMSAAGESTSIFCGFSTGTDVFSMGTSLAAEISIGRSSLAINGSFF